tara:strand:- start:242 stop:1129 length:888 start_codon:yes stop_codon:yes gene_type:complete
MIRRFFFFLSEAFIGMRRSFFMITVSMATIFISMVVFGFFLIVNFNLMNFSDYLNSKLEIRVFLNENLTKKEINNFSSNVLSLAGVEDVELVNRNKAWNDFKTTYSNLSLDKLLNENPLPASLIVKIKPEVNVVEVANLLNGYISIVDDVIYGGELATKMQTFSEFVQIIGWGVVCLLTIATFLIVINTIRLTIINRAEEISIMKLVGATDNFVMGPFLLEGLILGIVSSSLAIIVVYIGQEFYSYNISLLVPFLPKGFTTPQLYIVYISILSWGSLLSFMGALLSTRSTLKKLL